MDAFQAACLATRVEVAENALIVSVREQKLWHYRDGDLLATYPVSTSKRPPSNRENSLGTPFGLHRIEEKIGHGQPLGMVFKGRLPVGRHYAEVSPEEASRNLVTTRILRLRGLERGINRGSGIDSWERYIYIHGTNQEDLIGQPATAGCVALRNMEMLTLYEATPLGSLLWIRE